MADVQAAIEHIFPLVYEFRKERSKEELEALSKKKLKRNTCSELDPGSAGNLTFTKTILELLFLWKLFLMLFLTIDNSC